MDPDAQPNGPGPATPSGSIRPPIKNASQKPAEMTGPNILSSPSRRFVSVGTKLAGATIALVAAVTAVVYIELSAYQRESLLGAKEMAAVAVTTLFADSCAAAIVFGDEAGIKD